MAETSLHSPKHSLVIAVDGPAGAGKSTIARALAKRLGIPYLDTGAMYRAVGLLASRHGFTTPFDVGTGACMAAMLDEHSVECRADDDGFRVMLDGEDVSREIRTPEASAMASAVSALPEIRRALVPQQRRMGEKHGGVMEGRDIGTVVFPGADLKVFLTATPEERARRRLGDLGEAGAGLSLDEVRVQQARRDLQDSSRADSPLQVASGAVVVDTTGLDIPLVVDRLMDELRRRRPEVLDSNLSDAIKSRNYGRFERTIGAPQGEEER